MRQISLGNTVYTAVCHRLLELTRIQIFVSARKCLLLKSCLWDGAEALKATWWNDQVSSLHSALVILSEPAAKSKVWRDSVITHGGYFLPSRVLVEHQGPIWWTTTQILLTASRMEQNCAKANELVAVCATSLSCVPINSVLIHNIFSVSHEARWRLYFLL